MLPCTAEFLAAAKAAVRHAKAKIDVLWTDPFVLSGMTVSTIDRNNVSWHDPHIVDTKKTTPHKYLVLDGTCSTDGTCWLCPSLPEEQIENQLGWYSGSIADAAGDFILLPGGFYPAVTVEFADPRPIKQISVVGEPTIGQYPVTFDIYIYDESAVELFSDTYTGSSVETLIDLSAESINAAKSMKLVIKKWSVGNTMAKIVEFFGTVSDTFDGNDIVSMSILEEREVSDGSLPIGNYSSNEMDLELQNIEITRANGEVVKDPLFPDNTNSYLSSSITPNIRIVPYLGFQLPSTFEASASDILTTGEIHFSSLSRDKAFGYEISFGETVGDAVATIVDEVGITVSIVAQAYFSNYCVLGFRRLTGAAGTFKVKISGKKVVSENPVEYIKMGTFWTNDWSVDESGFSASVTARDRLELLRTVDFEMEEILENYTLAQVAEYVLNRAKQYVPMADLMWSIDTELSAHTIPVVWFEKQSYTQCLCMIAAACLGQLYMSKEDVLIIESYKANQTAAADLAITRDDYFSRRQPINGGAIKNHVNVILSPLVIEDEASEITTTDEITFAPGVDDISDYEILFGDTAVKDAAATPSDLVGVTVIITASHYYATRCILSFHKTSGTSGTFKVKITGFKLTKVTPPNRPPATDEDSIKLYGKKTIEYKENFLIQSETIADTIETALLKSYANPRKDVSIEWMGNPALELGDVVNVPVYTPSDTGISIAKDFVVFKNKFSFDGTLRCVTDARRCIDFT